MTNSASSNYQVDIFEALATVKEKDVSAFSAASVLVGPGAELDSQELLRLLLALEEVAEDKYGKRFEWMTDAAFSAKRSPFRTVESLSIFMAEQLS